LRTFHNANAGNVGNLPLVLVAALCDDPSSMIANAVEPGMCTELGIAYVVFAMWVAGLFQFTVVYFLLKPPPEVRPPPVHGLCIYLPCILMLNLADPLRTNGKDACKELLP
jgi:hypothetical protein